MPIDFFNLGDDFGWEAVPHNPGMWKSKKVDSAFHMVGFRCDPSTVVVRRLGEPRELFIVSVGDCSVEYHENGELRSHSVGEGQFWISDPDTPCSMTAGPSGVTYTVSRPVPKSLPA